MNKENKTHGDRMREKILQTIIQHIEEHGYAPTQREIGTMLGLKSPCTVNHHLEIMLYKGMIETDEEPECRTRAIRVPGYKFRNETPAEVTPYASAGDPSSMDIIDCPVCGKTYWAEDWGTINFCPNCGQAIKVKEVCHE